MEPVRRWRPIRVVGVVALVGVVVAVALVARHRLGPKHLLTVTPGVLYRSGQLTPEQLGGVIDRYAVRTVVNLRSENEIGQGDWHRREVETTAAHGARHLDLPMNTGFPPRDEVLAQWLDLLDDPDAQPILVHCEYGVIRTGIMVAVYEIERVGIDAERALSRFERFGRELPGVIQSRIDAYFADYVPRRASD